MILLFIESRAQDFCQHYAQISRHTAFSKDSYISIGKNYRGRNYQAPGLKEEMKS